MDRERSRSRQKVNKFRGQKSESQSKKFENNNSQRAPSNDRKGSQKSPSAQRQYPPNYQGNSSTQVRKSLSPNRMSQEENRPSNRLQKPSLKEIINKKIETMEQLASFLRAMKKPFLSSESVHIQTILQRMNTKYSFQRIYQVFVYFFIHSSSLDENLYKVFYGLIARNYPNDQSNCESLPRFYDVLIRTTIKTVFQQFRVNIPQIGKIQPSQYFLISQEKRQTLINKSLYSSAEAVYGCSIRSALALVRKSMQKEKTNDRNAQLLHPLRQILRVFKAIVKSALKQTFLSGVRQLQKQEKQKDKSNDKSKESTFYLLLISELSIVLHMKYKHHINSELDQTLNEITILKMKIAQVSQTIAAKQNQISQLQPASNEQNSQADDKKPNTKRIEAQKSLQTLANMQSAFQELTKEHQNNYLYVLFLLNLSVFNKDESGKSDMALMAFYLEPVLVQISGSSKFLQEKAQQNKDKHSTTSNHKKLNFFLSVKKNMGIKYKQAQLDHRISSLGQEFVNISFHNLLQTSIVYLIDSNKSQIVREKQQNSIKKQFIQILAALSPIYTTLRDINEFQVIQKKVFALRNAQLSLQIQREQNNRNREFNYLTVPLVQNLLKSIKQTSSKTEQRVSGFRFPQLSQKQPHIINLNYSAKVHFIQIEAVQKEDTLELLPSQITSWLESLKYQVKEQNYVPLLIVVFLVFKTKKHQLLLSFQRELLNDNLTGTKTQGKVIRNDLLIQNALEQQAADSTRALGFDKIRKFYAYVSRRNLLQQTTIQTIHNEISLKISNLGRNAINDQMHLRDLSDLVHKVSQALKPQLYQPQNIQADMLASVFMSLRRHDQNNEKRFELISKQIASSFRQIYPEQTRQSKLNQPEYICKVDQMFQNVKRLLKLYCSPRPDSGQQTLTNKIYHKKILLLRKQIFQQQEQIIAIIQLQYGKTIKVSRSLQIVQTVMERFFVQLFTLYIFQGQSASSPERNLIGNAHNQKQSDLRTVILARLNIKAFAQKQQFQQIQGYGNQEGYNKIQSLFGQILQRIYTRLSSAYSFIYKDLASSFNTSQNIENIPLQSQNLSLTLEQILIQKIKKCISLFLDKINQNMLNQFILQKKTFIMRSLVISFYKLKILSELLIGKYGCFDKIVSNNNQQTYVSKQTYQLVREVFFTVKSQALLEPLVKFIATKDKFYLKSQLVNIKNAFSSSAQQTTRYHQVLNIL